MVQSRVIPEPRHPHVSVASPCLFDLFVYCAVLSCTSTCIFLFFLPSLKLPPLLRHRLLWFSRRLDRNSWRLILVTPKTSLMNDPTKASTNLMFKDSLMERADDRRVGALCSHEGQRKRQRQRWSHIPRNVPSLRITVHRGAL